MADDPVTGQERTLPGTPRRREEARKRGEVAVSRELNSVLVLLTGLLVLYFSGTFLLSGIADSVDYYFGAMAAWTPEPENIRLLALDAIVRFFASQWPLFAAVIAVGILINLAQVGVNITFEVLQPKWNRLNPASGVKRIVSKRGLVELAKSLLKLTVLTWVSWDVIAGRIADIGALSDTGVDTILKLTVAIGFDIGIRTVIILLVLAVLDYAFQRHTHEQGLMMSPAEMKQEQKQYEGDPQIKARIRQVQREMAQRRMMEAVPGAEVVITNPTEFAIALSYTSDLAAPMVVARGRNLIAQRIREIAVEHDVPIVEDPPLAQALYRACEVGDYIPADLYQAVAQVLAYVYRLRPEKAPGVRPVMAGV